MGNANIDEELKNKILHLLEDENQRVKFQNLKGFIDNSCKRKLEEINNKPNVNSSTYKEINKLTGLNFANIVNSIYLVPVKEKITKNLQFEEKIKKTIANLGIKNLNKKYNMDNYYGLLCDFAWNMESHKTGAGLTPINYVIDELIKKYPSDEIKLKVFKSRLNYLEQREEEINYLIEKYDFNRIPLMLDWLNNKFEDYAEGVINLLLIIVQYYWDKIKLNKRISYENLANKVSEIHPALNSLNNTIELFIMVIIRHSIIHSIGYPIKNKNNDFIITIDIGDLSEPKKTDMNAPSIPKIKEFGHMKEYIEKVYSYYKGPKKINNIIEITDSIFPYLTLKYRIPRKGQPDIYRTGVLVEISLIEYLKISRGNIFLIAKAIFGKLSEL
ncbi:MAG TPA: hypothetical protein VJI68_02600 [Candidatus Nanoarchaeia archaeon]|nr:hypothetical protein [Candidatus Nanoarchaeia archaeon]